MFDKRGIQKKIYLLLTWVSLFQVGECSIGSCRIRYCGRSLNSRSHTTLFGYSLAVKKLLLLIAVK